MMRAILFDLDGTLFDRATSVRRCVEAQHERCYGLLRSVPVEKFVDRFLELDARGYVSKDRVYGQIASECRLPEGSAEFLYEDFYAHYHQHAVGFPDLHDTLGSLRSSGISLGILTNGRTSHQNATIRALGLNEYFVALLISESEGIRKPDTRAFLRGVRRLGSVPDQTVFVGDHPEVDIQGARAAGLKTIWKRDTFWGECAYADAIIEDLRSIPSILSSWASSDPIGLPPGRV